MTFAQKYAKFLHEFGDGRAMVLSTSLNDEVTSRMMSIVHIDAKFYFQTDKTFRKYSQLILNPKAALCIDNIQIEGSCKELGYPLDNIDFCKSYEKCFPSSYKRYTALKNERLFELTPAFVKRWIYIEGIPYTEVFEIAQKSYKLEQYQ